MSRKINPVRAASRLRRIAVSMREWWEGKHSNEDAARWEKRRQELLPVFLKGSKS